MDTRHQAALAATSVLANHLTEGELALSLGVSERTLIRWRRLRQAPPFTRIGRRIYYDRDAIGRWLASCQMGLDD